jgi:hypothetical protein
LIFDVDESIVMWELAAAIQLAAANGASIHLPEGFPEEYYELVEASGIKDSTGGMNMRLKFAEAYRGVDRSHDSYLAVLAKVSGLGVVTTIAPIFQSRQATENGAIVVCTEGLKAELDIPEAMWPAIVKFLRSYWPSVVLVGDPGWRIDAGAFSEAEILCDVPLSLKLDALASAKLIVGVPNAWTIIGSSWLKRALIFYPASLPQDRWFWISSARFGKILHDPNRINIPSIMSGLRELIRRYDD